MRAIYFSALLAFLWPVGPGAQIYKKPSELIAPDTLERIASAFNDPDPDYAEIASVIKREISSYTTQFIADKRILDERRVEPRPNLDKNTLRLITLLKNRKYGKIQFAGHSPYLRQLYEWLGRCYEALEDPYLALSSYSEALRYVALENPLQPDGSLAEREAIYLAMASSFANKERLTEEGDAALKADAEAFGRDISGYGDLKRQTELALKAIDAARADQVRGGNSSVAGARSSYENLKARLETMQNRMERIRLGSYRQYQQKRSVEDGNLAFRMAVVVKKLEIQNKELSRILNRSSFYRGQGDELGEERTALRNFVGYSIFLEFAHKLNPANLNYIALLVLEYRNGRQKERAIEFCEKYLELAKTINPPPAELADHQYILGGLYTDSKNFIRAAQAYEEYLKLGFDQEKIARTELQLAEISYRHTGQFDRALQLYLRVLSEKEKEDEQGMDYKTRSDARSLRYQINENLAGIYRRYMRTALEKDSMSKARILYSDLEKELALYKKEEAELIKNIFALKKDLLNREDANLQKDYYRMQRIDLPAIQEKIRYLSVRLDPLDLAELLERSAFLELRERNYPGALDLYAEIVERGNGAQATRARQNIEQVNLTLKDGRIRLPVLAPDFER